MGKTCGTDKASSKSGGIRRVLSSFFATARNLLSLSIFPWLSRANDGPGAAGIDSRILADLSVVAVPVVNPDSADSCQLQSLYQQHSCLNREVGLFVLCYLAV